MKNKASLVFFALFFACCGEGGRSTVTVQTASGNTTFTVELANTAAEREAGLMNRTDLADNAGMLFIWNEDVLTSFWMQNTPLSLDIIFIDRDHSVIYIAANTTPLSEDLITPPREFRYVLEVKAGFADRSGLAVGDEVRLNI